MAELWTGFGAMAALVAEPVFCIIDGVDECEDTANELVEKLLHFLTDHSSFRFILLRRHRAFHAVNCARHTVEVDSSLTEHDIKTLIEAEISFSDTLNAEDLVLRQQADGNLLWIKFMLRHLDSAANDSFDIKPMVQVLQKEGPFPPHFRLDLLKLQTYIRQFEKLTDPLQILFRALVRKASALPILALPLVAMLYYRVGREEDCPEILTVALEKARGKEGPLQS
ncbi:hypothetical protein GB937_010333 [Aspergillus fischeri]|nr:hypothetical protein GB937_010333 [Aspergillus fischeri]